MRTNRWVSSAGAESGGAAEQHGNSNNAKGAARSLALAGQLLREASRRAAAAGARLERALGFFRLNLCDALAVQLPLVDAALDVLLSGRRLARLVQPLVPLRRAGGKGGGWCWGAGSRC